MRNIKVIKFKGNDNHFIVFTDSIYISKWGSIDVLNFEGIELLEKRPPLFTQNIKTIVQSVKPTKWGGYDVDFLTLMETTI
jgi:hypothetical protein